MALLWSGAWLAGCCCHHRLMFLGLPALLLLTVPSATEALPAHHADNWSAQPRGGSGNSTTAVRAYTEG